MALQYYQLDTGRVLALTENTPFPPVADALTSPNGLLAIGSSVTPTRLLEAYHAGIFPWFNPNDPVLWWSPNPRMVLFPEELKVSRSLAKTLRRQDYQIRYNTAFNQVIEACANTIRRHEDGSFSNDTWITQEIKAGYRALHQMGYAISAETWIDDKLVGGLYGVAIGKMFYGESMFHHVTDGSKIAFVHLVQTLQQQGYGMIDCQMQTRHLASFGAREISRASFIGELQLLTRQPYRFIAPNSEDASA